MSKYKVGDKVHYTNANGIYIGVFKVIGEETRFGGKRYFLEDDGNPEHYSIRESQLKLADRFEELTSKKDTRVHYSGSLKGAKK